MLCFYVSQFAVHIYNLRMGLAVSVQGAIWEKEFLWFIVKAVEKEDVAFLYSMRFLYT